MPKRLALQVVVSFLMYFLLSKLLVYKVYNSNPMVEKSWMGEFVFRKNMPMGLLNTTVLSCLCHCFMALDSPF
jgi:hypothetical protein